MVEALALAGFRGIVIDRHGYEDGGAGLDSDLRALAGPPAPSSEDGRYTWYPLDARAAEMRAASGDAAFAERRTRLLNPIYLEWQRGFYAAEGSQRWSEARSAVAVDNPRSTPARVRITTGVCSGTPEPAAFTIRSAALEYSGDVTSRCIDLDIAATLPPGRTRIRFSTEAPRVHAPADTRALYFRLRDFRLVPADGSVEVIQNM
jgi:phosphoglycerol transferase